jgi:ABC-type sugar transport system substrate-binding protein
MLQAHSDMNLIVGSDQGIEGAIQAIGKKKIILVGYGGSATGIQGVAAGTWYGDVAQLPAGHRRQRDDQGVAIVVGQHDERHDPDRRAGAGGSCV